MNLCVGAQIDNNVGQSEHERAWVDREPVNQKQNKTDPQYIKDHIMEPNRAVNLITYCDHELFNRREDLPIFLGLWPIRLYF
jgi:hypothetical protein